MEAEKNKAGNMNSVLRQALERRQTEHLSSNFSYRMMERVRLEAERQRKRRVRIGWMALLRHCPKFCVNGNRIQL